MAGVPVGNSQADLAVHSKAEEAEEVQKEEEAAAGPILPGPAGHKHQNGP